MVQNASMQYLQRHPVHAAMASVEEKSAYELAVMISPDVVLDESPPERFLSYCQGDVWEAARRLACYWQLREEALGSRQLACCPILTAISPQDLSAFFDCKVALLPRNKNGHAVIFVDMTSRRISSSRMSPSDLLRLFWIVMHLAIFSDGPSSHLGNPWENGNYSCSRGITVVLQINAGAHSEMQVDSELFSFIARAFAQGLCGRPVQLHVCYDSTSAEDRNQMLAGQSLLPALLAQITSIWGPAITIATHAGTTDQVVESLHKYGLEECHLPVSLGGRWQIQQRWMEWLLEQVAPKQEGVTSDVLAADNIGTSSNETGGVFMQNLSFVPAVSAVWSKQCFDGRSHLNVPQNTMIAVQPQPRQMTAATNIQPFETTGLRSFDAPALRLPNQFALNESITFQDHDENCAFSFSDALPRSFSRGGDVDVGDQELEPLPFLDYIGPSEAMAGELAAMLSCETSAPQGCEGDLSTPDKPLLSKSASDNSETCQEKSSKDAVKASPRKHSRKSGKKAKRRRRDADSPSAAYGDTGTKQREEEALTAEKREAICGAIKKHPVHEAMNYVADTDAYLQAVASSPEVIWEESNPELYAEYCADNYWKAAERLAYYWSFRLEIFGPDLAFLRLRDALRPADWEFLRLHHRVVLPQGDSGRPASFVDRSFYSTNKIRGATLEVRYRTMFVYFHILQQVARSSRGAFDLILRINPHSISRRKFDKETFDFLKRALTKALCCHYHKLHFVKVDNDGGFGSAASSMAVKLFLKTFARASSWMVGLPRVCHMGPPEEVMTSLKKHGFASEQIPNLCGGMLNPESEWHATLQCAKLLQPRRSATALVEDAILQTGQAKKRLCPLLRTTSTPDSVYAGGPLSSSPDDAEIEKNGKIHATTKAVSVDAPGAASSSSETAAAGAILQQEETTGKPACGLDDDFASAVEVIMEGRQQNRRNRSKYYNRRKTKARLKTTVQ